jgi:hypothetical protein
MVDKERNFHDLSRSHAANSGHRNLSAYTQNIQTYEFEMGSDSQRISSRDTDSRLPLSPEFLLQIFPIVSHDFNVGARGSNISETGHDQYRGVL